MGPTVGDFLEQYLVGNVVANSNIYKPSTFLNRVLSVLKKKLHLIKGKLHH